MIVVKVFAMFGDTVDHMYSQTSPLMFTFRKSRLTYAYFSQISSYVYSSQISLYFWSIGFYNSSINPFVSTLGILFWLMNLPNWTITLYFSTSEFKLDTLLSVLACHSNYGEKFLLIRSDEYRKKKTSFKLAP